MIPTSQIRAALLAFLTASMLFEKVIAHNTANLGEALTHLRDTPSSIAVIIPGDDQFTHEYEPGTNIPVRTEVTNVFELLISARNLEMTSGDGVEALDFKDQVLALLLWDNLSVPDLICMPTLCEPMIITFDEAQSAGREAWKITLELRHAITA